MMIQENVKDRDSVKNISQIYNTQFLQLFSGSVKQH